MKKILREAKIFLKSKSARFFYVALLVIVALLVLSLIYMPAIFKAIAGILLTSLVAIFFAATFGRAKTKGKLNLEHDLLTSIVRNLNDAVIAYDSDFKVLNFNKKAETLFEVKESEIVGKIFSIQTSASNPSLTLLRQVMFPSLAPSIHPISKPGEYPQVVNLSFENPFMELQSITIPISGESGQGAFVKIIHDRTRAVNFARSKNEFITVASHQLRTPLSAINWAFQELAKPDLDDATRRSVFTAGSQAAQKLSNIVRDFLDVTKIEEGRFGFEFKEEEITSFIQKVVDEAAPVAMQRKVNVFFEKPDKQIQITMDASKIAMVLSNLLDNSIKYNVENGQVIVRIKEKEAAPFVEITVEDTGVGVKQDEVDKLFTKFYRSETVTKKDTTGSGLGLYIAKNIIRQHGGQIWVESVFGRGSTFHFTLPTDSGLIPQREVGTFGQD
ncbi:MAG: PAS domain-containing sensor histidine kinase [Candidatus Paceibacterota bacterium]